MHPIFNINTIIRAGGFVFDRHAFVHFQPFGRYPIKQTDHRHNLGREEFFTNLQTGAEFFGQNLQRQSQTRLIGNISQFITGSHQPTFSGRRRKTKDRLNILDLSLLFLNRAGKKRSKFGIRQSFETIHIADQFRRHPFDFLSNKTNMSASRRRFFIFPIVAHRTQTHDFVQRRFQISNIFLPTRIGTLNPTASGGQNAALYRRTDIDSKFTSGRSSGRANRHIAGITANDKKISGA